MINVTLVTNSGDGCPRLLEARDGVLLEDFLDVNFDGDLDKFIVSIRRNGESFEPETDEVLLTGDRVCLAPRNVKGEIL